MNLQKSGVQIDNETRSLRTILTQYFMMYFELEPDFRFRATAVSVHSSLLSLSMAVHREQRAAAEGQSAASLTVSVALSDDNKDNFLQDNGARAYSGLSVSSPRMALSAVNILHLNGPLDAKQTPTGFHTNDRRGAG